MSENKLTKEKGLSEYTEILSREMPDLRETYHVKSLAVFGSYLHQNQNQESDLDLLVDFDETPTLFQFIRLENHLTEILDVKVDLVMKNALKPTIGKRVLEEAQQL